MSFKRNLKLSFAILLLIMIAPILGIYFYFNSSDYDLLRLFKITIVLFAVTWLLWLLGILLHLSYYFNDKGKVFKLNNSNLEVIEKDMKWALKLKDVQKIQRVKYGGSAKCPWTNYGFIVILMNDKSTQKITCLTADPFSLAFELSRKSKIEVEERKLAIPYLCA